MTDTEAETIDEQESGLRCPDPNCPERFHNANDEHRIATLVYHLGKDHPSILANLKTKLGVDRDE